MASAFANHLEKAHKTHEGPEFCQTTKIAIDKEITTNPQLFMPCFPPLKEEQGDDHFLAEAIHDDDVIAALKKTKAKTAPGIDEIPPIALKKSTPKLISILSQLFTICLLSGYFPRPWKNAEGIMLLKQGKDKKLPGSYRPISLLSCIGKLFERTIAARLSIHLEDTNFFNPFQRAYRKGKEGGEHIFRLTEQLTAAKKKGYKTAAASLDVEKAFDAVWHNGLRHKLAAPTLGLPRKITRLLSNYLQDRHIKVRVGRSRSRMVPLCAGTPQGSVLSPTLFNMYVNDIPLRQNAMLDAGTFADDTTLWASAAKKNTAIKRMQISIKQLEPWLSKWRIKVNAKKTQFICFGTQGNEGKITLCGEVIKEGKTIKFLGTTFDKALSAKPHCTEIASRAMSRVHLLRRIRGKTWGASKPRLTRFYKQFIRPVLENGYAYSATGKTSALKRLRVVQNAAMRTILCAPPRSRIVDMEKKTGLPDVHLRLTSLKSAAQQRYQGSSLMKMLQLRLALLNS